MGIKILITGDFCPINRIQELIAKKSYNEIFHDFIKYSQKSDLSITNLECPLTRSDKEIPKTGPTIKCDPNAMDALKYAGFQLVTMANNHILDYGSEGLKSTIDACAHADINYVGAGMNITEARKPFYTKLQNKVIAIYNVAENEFGNTYGDEPGGNPLNPVSNFYDISEAKKKADYVFVIAHGGREHYQLPSPRIKQLYRFFADSGADAVIAHHTHCYSGYEIYNNKPIFYGLGNFIFDYKKKYQTGLWVEGFAVEFNIDDIGISFELIPYYQGRSENPTLQLFNEDERKDFDDKLENLNKIISDDNRLKEEWNSYLKTEEISYKSSIYIQNKYIRELIRRGILPPYFMHSKSHSLVLLNLLRCETHREIMIEILKKQLSVL